MLQVAVRARAHLAPLGWWEDPLLPGSRRLPARAPRRLFPSVDAAARGLLATKRLVDGCARAAAAGVPPPAGEPAGVPFGEPAGEPTGEPAALFAGRAAAAGRELAGSRARGLSDVEDLAKRLPGGTGLGTWGLESGSSEVNPWAVSLDDDGGAWRFRLVAGPEALAGFEAPALDDRSWETVAVPGTWQVE
jgi:hypothetical protein